jgi:hypothetical protein
MSEIPDWAVWPLAAGLIVLFGWFFWHTGRSLVQGFLAIVETIQNWPQTRRAMVEAEARAGGRYPWWFRAVRVSLVLATVGLAAYVIFRRTG